MGKPVEYVRVLSDVDKMNAMLKYSGGKRQVPVIVEEGRVTIGYNGNH